MQVHNFLENSAKNYPQKRAVWFEKEWFTYGEIDSKSAKLCSYLVNNGIKKGDRVALLLDNSIDYIIAYFGILKAGAVVVGLNTELSISLIGYKLINSRSKIVITGRKYIDKFIEVRKALNGTLTNVIVDKPLITISQNNLVNNNLEHIYYSEEEASSVRTIDLDLAEIVYTSGSTGQPKGVMLTHLNLTSNMYSIVKYLHLTENDRIMVILPFNYIYGKSLLLTHFLAGGSVVIDNRFTYPNLVLETMQKTEVTGFAGVPSSFSILLSRSNLDQIKFDSLRYITQAGGAMAPALQEAVAEIFSPAKLYVMYGATEAAPRLSYLEPEMLRSKLGSIGKPVDNVELKILDIDGSVVAQGKTGEIAARGSNIMKGYWKDPVGTEKVFCNGYYLTGDLGKKDQDGYFYVVGRKNDFIKSKGYKVSAKAIEENIMEFDGVQEVAVTSIPDEELGEAIKAYIVPQKNVQLKQNEIRDFLREKLASYKIPKYILFVNSLPKNKSGKILKKELS